jgi:polyhydroxyalkanoate synthesis repressor PhaR
MATARRSGKADAAAAHSGPRILKKYPNRRLYDTQTSSYITLADVKQMVLGGTDFEVRDAKSGEDITRSILLQIILEEETGGVPMFSTQMLSQIIRFYGHTMQGFMGTYLEKNIQAFAELQKRLADPKTFGPDAWTQFMNGQSPLMQGLMGNYLEQSKTLFAEMQKKMAEQAETLMPGFPGFPGARK